MSSALVFTAYERPHYWRPTLESWSRVRGIQDWPITIFLEPSSVQEEMITMARDILPYCEIRINPARLGVLNNPYYALKHGFSMSDFVVLAEEDIVVSADILEYFEWAKEGFEADKSVLGACAFADGSAELPDSSEVKLYEWFSPWLWGTWKDRWESIIDPTWDHDYSNNGWDCNLGIQVTATGRGFLFPTVSRSNHIGQLGEHMTINNRLSVPTMFIENREVCNYQRSGNDSPIQTIRGF